MRRVLGVLAIVLVPLLATSCTLPPAPGAGYACNDAHPCIDGQSCFHGACLAACASASDCLAGQQCRERACVLPAGGLDAGPDDDDGGVDGGLGDAGPVDGGGEDAGPDGGVVGDDGGTLCFGDPPECFPSELVVQVCPAEPCPEGRTAATVGGAMQVGGDPIVVFVPSGNHSGTIFADGRDVTVIGEEGAVLTDNDEALIVEGGARVVIHNLDLATDGNRVVDISEGSVVDIERSRISDSSEVCIETTPGTFLTLERCVVTNCHKGGLDLDGDGRIVNSVFTDNGAIGGGANGSSVGGVLLRGDPANTTFRFNTLIQNHANDAPGVRCASSGFVVDSCVLWDNLGSSSFDPDAVGCTLTRSVVETGGTADAGNLFEDPELVDGGFHIAITSPCIDQGVDDATVLDDFDGEARPQGGGRDIGADEAD